MGERDQDHSFIARPFAGSNGSTPGCIRASSRSSGPSLKFIASPNVPANTLPPAFSTGIPNICDRSAPRATNISASSSNRATVFGPAFGIFCAREGIALLGRDFAGVFLDGIRRMLPWQPRLPHRSDANAWCSARCTSVAASVTSEPNAATPRRCPTIGPAPVAQSGQSGCLLSSGSQVRVLPGALPQVRGHRMAWHGCHRSLHTV
jgi:hypothetical protein